MRKLTVIGICVLLLLTTSIFGIMPFIQLHAQDASAVEPWVAPSVVGLDWTKPEWSANLPKYDTALGAQPLSLVSDAPVTISSPESPGNWSSPQLPSEIPRNSAGNPGPLTVTGRFTTVLSNDLYNGASIGPYGIVWGYVQIRSCASGSPFLGDGLTGPRGATEGTFSISVTNPGASGFRAWLIPWTLQVNVRTGTGNQYSYMAYTSCWYNKPDGTFSIGTWTVVNPTFQGAWMIYETLINDHRGWGAWNFFRNRLSTYWIDFQGLVVRFPFETWAHYHPGGEMHLPTMNDARSPDVVQHEYGHFAMYKTYGTWFTTYCPSPHYINGISHVNCAYSEGWASYIPYMTHGDKTYTYANNFDVNEETPTWGTSGWANGPAVEGRVTGALIDLTDTGTEGWDITSGWGLPLWYIFRYKAAPAVVVNYHDFMAWFKTVHGYKTPIVLTNWYNTIYYTDL